MALLQEFVEIFFGMPCQLLDPLDLNESRKLRGRSNPLPHLQTRPIQSVLGKKKRNALCLVGVIMVDLYPDKHWNSVFGEASPSEGVGVFSCVRYTETFNIAWEQAVLSGGGEQVVTDLPKWPEDPLSSDEGRLLLLRAFRTLAHEIGHLFRLDHCEY
jgi:archaemetzincin